MRLTIIKDDGVVFKDRRALEIDLSDFPANIHAIQWDGVAGHVEYNDGKPNAKITDLVSFQTWIDRWQAAADAEDAPPPPDPPEVAKEKQKKVIELQRDITLSAGLTWNGNKYHIDQTMVAALNGRLTLWQEGKIAVDAKLPIRRMDNAIELLDRAQHADLADALRLHGEAVYAASWAEKDKL